MVSQSRPSRLPERPNHSEIPGEHLSRHIGPAPAPRTVVVDSWHDPQLIDQHDPEGDATMTEEGAGEAQKPTEQTAWGSTEDGALGRSAARPHDMRTAGPVVNRESNRLYFAAFDPSWHVSNDTDKSWIIRSLVGGLILLAIILVGCVTTLLIMGKEASALVAVLSTVVGGLIGLFIESPTSRTPPQAVILSKDATGLP